jgi:AcrR family transcriptional regulator
VSSPTAAARPPDRRALRRQQTIEEVLDRALGIMAEDGVAGLTMTKLARAMGIQPPSLYKYFPSALAVHDALFARGQRANLDAWHRAVTGADPGLAALAAGLEATGRWAVANPVLAQLLFWRPVPGFVPSPEAFAPAVELQAALRAVLADAVGRAELDPAATGQEAVGLLAVLHFGVLSQHLANEPEADWESGSFTRLHRTAVGVFVAAHRPAP